MNSHHALGAFYSEAFSSDVARSALPDAPVQPYKPRRRLGRRRRVATRG